MIDTKHDGRDVSVNATIGLNMAHSLAKLWKENPSFLESKSFRQIIQIAGDGKLLDDNQTSLEVREWLRVVELERLRSCADECLEDSFDGSGHALQDVVNELGSRLGFVVTNGRYRGTKSDIGNDGLWAGEDGFRFVVEVKTTDAYRINLGTLAGYREKLILRGEISKSESSILIVVGRQDTGDLEAQIRGSPHAWDVRLISVDGLLRLSDIKQELDDLETSRSINVLLRPLEYTRLDGIVDLLFATKQDLGGVAIDEAPTATQTIEEQAPSVVPTDLESARSHAISRIESALNTTFIRRGKSLRASPDDRVRLVCLASQRYEGSVRASHFWYGLTPSHREFLLDAQQDAYLALVAGTSTRTFLLSRQEVLKLLPDLWTTPPSAKSIDEIRHWHIYLTDFGDRVE